MKWSKVKWSKGKLNKGKGREAKGRETKQTELNTTCVQEFLTLAVFLHMCYRGRKLSLTQVVVAKVIICKAQRNGTGIKWNEYLSSKNKQIQEKKKNCPKNLKRLTKTKTIEGSWPHRGPA